MDMCMCVSMEGLEGRRKLGASGCVVVYVGALLLLAVLVSHRGFINI